MITINQAAAVLTTVAAAPALRAKVIIPLLMGAPDVTSALVATAANTKVRVFISGTFRALALSATNTNTTQLHVCELCCCTALHYTLHIVHMQASASCARRAMEVLVVLVGIATEIGRPVEQVRRLEARGLRR
jgi:hypothetical protein